MTPTTLPHEAHCMKLTLNLALAGSASFNSNRVDEQFEHFDVAMMPPVNNQQGHILP